MKITSKVIILLSIIILPQVILADHHGICCLHSYNLNKAKLTKVFPSNVYAYPLDYYVNNTINNMYGNDGKPSSCLPGKAGYKRGCLSVPTQSRFTCRIQLAAANEHAKSSIQWCYHGQKISNPQYVTSLKPIKCPVEASICPKCSLNKLASSNTYPDTCACNGSKTRQRLNIQCNNSKIPTTKKMIPSKSNTKTHKHKNSRRNNPPDLLTN